MRQSLLEAEEARPDPGEAQIEAIEAPGEVVDRTEAKVTEVVELPGGVPDTHPHPQNPAVTAIMFTVTKLGIVLLLSPALGKTSVSPAEVPASLQINR